MLTELEVRSATTVVATTETALADIVITYNRLAEMLEKPLVKRFSDRKSALKRLEALQAEAKIKFTPAVPARKARAKVFNYPPSETIKAVKPGSLRGECFELLVKGATLGRIEQLIKEWDAREGKTGKTTERIEPRAYGLVRLLHTWAGYALRQEQVGDQVVIYVMNRSEWIEWKKSTQAKAA